MSLAVGIFLWLYCPLSLNHLLWIWIPLMYLLFLPLKFTFPPWKPLFWLCHNPEVISSVNFDFADLSICYMEHTMVFCHFWSLWNCYFFCLQMILLFVDVVCFKYHWLWAALKVILVSPFGSFPVLQHASWNVFGYHFNLRTFRSFAHCSTSCLVGSNFMFWQCVYCACTVYAHGLNLFIIFSFKAISCMLFMIGSKQFHAMSVSINTDTFLNSSHVLI